MNKKDAAAFLDVGTRTLERYTSEGRITPTRFKGKNGMTLDYNESDLAKLKEEIEAVQGIAIASPPPSPPTVASPATAATTDTPATTLARAPRQSGQQLARVASPDSTPSRTPAKPPTDLVQARAKMVLTIEEAAALTGFSAKRIRDAITDGSLPAVRVGRPWQILPEALQTWVYSLFQVSPPPTK